MLRALFLGWALARRCLAGLFWGVLYWHLQMLNIFAGGTSVLISGWNGYRVDYRFVLVHDSSLLYIHRSRARHGSRPRRIESGLRDHYVDLAGPRWKSKTRQKNLGPVFAV